ncbi:MAG: glycosyltransferase family 4 protein [Actinobacteria bacterium]|nr:glycosyltransferase family 4 protein [Actinomycetota bacterium]
MPRSRPTSPSSSAPDLVINGRFLTQPLTGVQRFALEITRHLAHLRPVEVLRPPLPGGTLPVDPATLTVVGRRSGQAWEQFELPAALRRRGRPLLLNLGSTGPLAYGQHISTHHDITYVRHPESFSRLFRTQYRAMIPPLLRGAQRVLTVSEFSRGELAAHFHLDPTRIEVVNNAVAPVFTEDGPRHREREPYLLGVSSPNAHKNFRRLVEAFRRATRHRIRRLLIVGSQAPAFRSASLGNDDEVVMLGRVGDDELGRLYRGAAAFAFPSLYEGFGLPPLEAQACGTPVIAARAASIPEVLGDSALYFDPFSVASIAEAIEAVDASPAVGRRLIEAGRQNVRRFSWERSAEIVSNVLDDVLAASARGMRAT